MEAANQSLKASKPKLVRATHDPHIVHVQPIAHIDFPGTCMVLWVSVVLLKQPQYS